MNYYWRIQRQLQCMFCVLPFRIYIYGSHYTLPPVCVWIKCFRTWTLYSTSFYLCNCSTYISNSSIYFYYTYDILSIEGSQTNEALLSLLEERNLDFLVPSLRLSTELSHLIMDTSSLEGKCPEESDKITASKFNDYLSNHPIDARIRASDYIHACLPVIYEYIHRVGIIDLGSLSSPPTLMAREKAAWECIVPHVLIEVLRSSTDRQLDALHDLQSFWVDKNMPKGQYTFKLCCPVNHFYISWW